MRWYTPTFPGSAGNVPLAHVCRQRYERVQLTNTVVVEQLDHMERTVAIAPHWTIDGLWYINHTPLGTTLQCRAWDTAMALKEADAHEVEEAVVPNPFVQLVAAVQNVVHG